jgi:hypothetical protein
MPGCRRAAGPRLPIAEERWRRARRPSNAREIWQTLQNANFFGLLRVTLYATIYVLFLVAGIYFGGSGLVADADMKTALAALMGIVALGGFAVRQWLKYQHQTLKYHMDLSENIYFRNVNNNAGIFDYLIATAEGQQTRESGACISLHPQDGGSANGDRRCRPGRDVARQNLCGQC